MAEKESGKNNAYYRKKKGLPQEKMEVLLGNEGLAEDAQTIKTSNIPWILMGISALSILLYTIISVWQGSFSVGAFLCVFIMGVPIQFFSHVYFANAVKKNSFTGIAGFHKKTEYNLPEVKRLLVQLDLQLGIMTTVYIVLMCVAGCSNAAWLGELLLCLYILEFMGTILFMNYKSMDRLYVHEEDKNRTKAEFPLTVAYILVLLAGMGLMFLLFEWKGIENNTMPALKLSALYLLGAGIATAGVLIKKQGSRWCLLAAVIVYIIMLFAV